MKNIIKIEKFYDYPIQRVWHAISDARAISEWFIEADFKAEVGYQYKFKHESTIVTGQVLEANPPTELIYTWKVGEMEVVTTVKWLLEAQNHGTLLLLEHAGFENYEDVVTVEEMFKASTTGWNSVVNQLQGYLEKRQDGDK